MHVGLGLGNYIFYITDYFSFNYRLFLKILFTCKLSLQFNININDNTFKHTLKRPPLPLKTATLATLLKIPVPTDVAILNPLARPHYIRMCMLALACTS